MEFLIIGLTFLEIPILELQFSQVVDNLLYPHVEFSP